MASEKGRCDGQVQRNLLLPNLSVAKLVLPDDSKARVSISLHHVVMVEQLRVMIPVFGPGLDAINP